MRIKKQYIATLQNFNWNNVSKACKISICEYHIDLHIQQEAMYQYDLAMIEEILENRKIPSNGKMTEICKKDQELFSEHISRIDFLKKLYTEILAFSNLSEIDSKVYKLLLESSKRVLADYEKKKKEAQSREKNLRKALEYFEFILENADLLEARCKAMLSLSRKSKNLHKEELNDLENWKMPIF